LLCATAVDTIPLVRLRLDPTPAMNQHSKSDTDTLWHRCSGWLRALPVLVGVSIAFIGFPMAVCAWVVYHLIAPLFSTNPWSEYQQILGNVGIFGLVLGCLLGAIGAVAGLVALGERFRIARWTLRALIALLVGAVALGGILELTSGRSSSCLGFGRHSNC
jgi:hypothetical protein